MMEAGDIFRSLLWFVKSKLLLRISAGFYKALSLNGASTTAKDSQELRPGHSSTQLFFANIGATQPVSQTIPIFCAFEIFKEDIVAKAYYFLRPKSGVMQSDWATVAEAIFSAPHCIRDNISAMRILEECFTNNVDRIDVEMLAIDLIEPHDSRIKTYFRFREISFGSVEQSMTLDGQIRDEATARELRQLDCLWNDLFDVQSGEPLQHVEHRTASILYHAEFRIDSKLHSVKVYLPVRHHTLNDRSVIEALGRHFEGIHDGLSGKFRSYQRPLNSIL
jgi:DMATS type aromatic prenyltransferase